MTASEVAQWLNYEATDEQFAETFALLEIMSYGRQAPQIYDQKEIIKSMNITTVCRRLNEILSEIKTNQN